MPETVFGLPVHPLAVHGAVVLAPLAAVMAIAVAVDPARRARLGVLTWLLAAAATMAAVAARLSGQNLAAALYPHGLPDQVIDHQSFGQASPWFTLALWGGTTALLLDQRRPRRPGVVGDLLPSVLSVLVILVAMAVTTQVLWTGWTGAEARWGGVVPESLLGVPVHPLVVHAVVVLLPLAALGVLVLSVVPRSRRTFSGFVVVVALVGVALVPVATKSGETLRETVGTSASVQRHADLGDRVIWFAVALLAAAVALWWLARRERASHPVGRGPAVAVAVASALVALAVVVQVVLVGHSGSEAVWSGVVSAPATRANG
jgi:hypothetical protein